MRPSSYAAAVVLVASSAAAQRDFSQVEIKPSKVAGSVYVLEGAGGNIGVSVGDDGILIVDDQFAPLAPKIKAALKTIADKPVRFVLNTHWHGDHTGGNAEFQSPSTPVIAHANVRKRLAEGMAIPERTRAPEPKAALPIITFDERLTVHLNGEDIRAIHFPRGHTDGDAIVFFTGSNVVHMGDDFFAGRFPFIDLDSGGSVRGLIATVKKLAAELPAGVRIIPGHGPVSGIAELRAYLAMLEDAAAIVEAGIKKGKTAAELKKEKALARHESWSHPFVTADRFIDTLYRDLSR